MTPAALIAFEARWPRHTPAKAEAVRQELGISAIRYYQLLHRAASSEEGIRAAPVTARLVRCSAVRRASVREERTSHSRLTEHRSPS